MVRSLKRYNLVRADFALATRWDTCEVYPVVEIVSPRRVPLGLNSTSSPSTISGAGVLVARGTTLNLARFVLILHSF